MLVTYRFVDYLSQDSIVGRDYILRSSCDEQCAIVSGAAVEGRRVSLLDLSSYSPTMTFKDWVACFTIAYCFQNGIDRFITQSSGNTANALAYYSELHKVRSILFYPKQSRYKIRLAAQQYEYVHLVEVDKSEKEIKRLTDICKDYFRLPWLPNYQLQISANEVRARIVAEYEKTNPTFNWHVQSLSSAYGIFGFYAGIQKLIESDVAINVPKILGIQQEAICPYFASLMNQEHSPNEALMIEPTLFRSAPSPEMIATLRGIVRDAKGAVNQVLNSEVSELIEPVMEIMSTLNMPAVGRSALSSTGYRELAGVLAIAGLIKAVRTNVVEAGSNVLIAYTGGTYAEDGVFEPRHTIPRDADDLAVIDLVQCLV